jgi:hypothetical protein
LEYACKDDVELCEIIGNDIGNTDLVKQWIEKRMRRKRRDFMQPKIRIVMAHNFFFHDWHLLCAMVEGLDPWLPLPSPFHG